MKNKIIWVLSFSDECLDIEVYFCQNKYTKAGLFSGPLRKSSMESTNNDKNFQFFKSLSGVIQVGVNKYKVNNSVCGDLFNYFREKKVDECYWRLKDKKLHHIVSFIPIEQEDFNFKYNDKTQILYYEYVPNDNHNVLTRILEPKVRLYMLQENKNIRVSLFFIYNDIEVAANISEESIATDTGNVFRNWSFENIIKEKIISLGGTKSFRNEFLFSNNFFNKVLPALIKEKFDLFWGEGKKAVLKTGIKFSISYDMNWFLISGKVEKNNIEYTLSDILKNTRGKNFAEIDNKIVFLPEEIINKKLSVSNTGEIRIPHNRLNEIISLGEKINIKPDDYINKILDFHTYSATLPDKIKNIMKKYQNNGVNWILTLYKNEFGCCLADDMGLGKTLQAISFLCCKERNKDMPVLVIVPKTILYNWKKEFEKFAPFKNVIIAYGNYDYSLVGKANSVYITTYETIVFHNDFFSKAKFDVVILDEAQFIKNFRTKRYRAIKNLNTKFFLALTGTPIENNIEELWSLFNLLNPGLLGTHTQFISKFADINTNEYRLQILKKVISRFILRRTKEEVLKELPRKEEIYIYCNMDRKQRTLYNKILLSVQNELKAQPSRFKIKDNTILLQALLYLREVCSDPQLLPYVLRETELCNSCKYELFKEYALKVMSSSNKLIVYGLFPRVLKKMRNWCNIQGWNTFYIDGNISNRQDIVDDFEKATQGIFFISLKAGGVGLNLVSCQYVFMYDPWWNLAAEQQAINRVYRIGQEKPVFIYHFLVKDTIEEKMYNLQKKKDCVINDVLSDVGLYTQFANKELYKLLLQNKV